MSTTKTKAVIFITRYAGASGIVKREALIDDDGYASCTKLRGEICPPFLARTHYALTEDEAQTKARKLLERKALSLEKQLAKLRKKLAAPVKVTDLTGDERA